MVKAENKTACAYIRVSTDKQDEYSPAAQKRLILEYASKNGYLISENDMFQDIGISGTTSDKRTSFNEMIAKCKSKDHPYDAIIVWKFSRFARNQEESVIYKAMLRKENVDVVSISEPIADGLGGKLTEAILEIMDEYYSINLSGEVKRGMIQATLQGKYISSPPIGYKKNGKGTIPVIDESTISVVKSIFNLCLQGVPTRAIALRLNQSGVATPKNKKWEYRAVEYILNNPFYMGKIRYNYRSHKGHRPVNKTEDIIIVDGSHEPIISEIDFFRVQEILRSQRRANDKGRMIRKHYLSGIVKCAECGGSMTWHKERTNRSQPAFFTCRNYGIGACNCMQYISSDKLVEAFISGFKECIDRNTYAIQEKASTGELKALYEEQLKQIAKKEERIKESYIAGIDTIEEYRENKTAIEKEKETILAKIEACTGQKEKLSAQKLYDILTLLQSDAISDEEKNLALKEVLEKVVFDKKNDTLDFYFF